MRKAEITCTCGLIFTGEGTNKAFALLAAKDKFFSHAKAKHGVKGGFSFFMFLIKTNPKFEYD